MRASLFGVRIRVNASVFLCLEVIANDHDVSHNAELEYQDGDKGHDDEEHKAGHSLRKSEHGHKLSTEAVCILHYPVLHSALKPRQYVPTLSVSLGNRFRSRTGSTLSYQRPY